MAAVMAAVAVIAWGLGFAYVTTTHVLDTYTPQLHAVMETRNQVAQAHLWFEELVADDDNESIEQVHAHMDQAAWYLNALLHGGGNQKGVHMPVEHHPLRQAVLNAQNKLDTFRDIMETRWARHATDRPGTALDQEFDAIFRGLLVDLDDVESRLRTLSAQEQTVFERVLFAVFGAIALTLVVLVGALVHYHRHQTAGLDLLQKANLRLTREVDRRGRAERSLQDARDGLEERVKARTRQLHESEERFRALIETSSDWIWEINVEGTYTYVSPKVQDILGYMPEEVMGHSPFDFMTPDSAMEVGEAFAVIVEKQEPFRDLENVNLHKDGHEVILETSGVPFFDDDGTLLGWRGIDRDITRRKRSEGRLRTLSQAVEQSADMVFITNRDGTIEYVNESFVRLTGYSPEDAIGQNPRFLSSGDTPREIYQDLWATVLRGETWRNELKDRRKNGDIFWSAVTITPIKDERGEICHFVSTHEDITERKRAEEATLKALRQTDIANKAKSELIANMSHELRTPLNAILGFSETIREGVFGPLDNPQYQEYMGLIYSSAAHLLDIINDILDVSALEAGRMDLVEDETDMTDIIESCASLIAFRAREGDVTVTTEVSADAPLLFVDGRRIKQVVLNLLSNAVKFTEPGGTVTVAYARNDEERPVLSVRDTGVGMTEDEQVKAMSQFGQVDSGLDRKHEGTGLGLPLAKGLVDMHGAAFSVASVKGEGTTITVTFPRARIRS